MNSEQSEEEPDPDGFVGDGINHDFEDCLVGDEAGLRKLILVCETALEQGSCAAPGAWDYHTVVNMDAAPVPEPPKPTWKDRLTKLGCLLVFAVAVVCLGIGALSLIDSIKGLFH